jgi:hypothetical protein
MLIAESTRRSRLSVLYGILAQSALSQFDANPPKTRRSAYFQNLITLLEMYRYETLRQPSHRAVLDRRETTKREFQQENMEAEVVERALKAAHNAVYATMSKEQMVEHLKGLFLQITQKDFNLAAKDIRHAKLFLETFAKALRN